MPSLEIFSQNEPIASLYARSLNLGYAANCCFPWPRPHRDIFGDCLVWYGHISGLLGLQTARREGKPL
ncbi:hypothetical protein CORC01_07068 [Colletotrichum orchidophilum]|uniref:Uncharacterized protein n=1 Tax=Colletotrichum orchidophilum TaxID=1209926 RepID=A0A1G4B8L1_9PEZI|nr:uncharacterized protein CORC01_07068 [Colletotrichum orchidophilum]OHE97653.1 hypothetical protein CORC01_07068 [Colletotrichum orchidophilum]